MPPVDDIPVHQLVSIKADKPYLCHNRKPYTADYFAPDRIYRPDGTFYVVQSRIVHAMSRECRYDMADSDARCSGCKTPKDVQYLSELKRLQSEK